MINLKKSLMPSRGISSCESLTPFRTGEKLNRIGFEGSGLTSDKLITVSTKWLAPDESLLPTSLKGYTGRVAKVIRPQTLGSNNDAIGIFEIKPGPNNKEFVKLGESGIQNTGKEHFYVHVSGEPKYRNPDFSSGNLPAPLDSRPKYFAPFKTWQLIDMNPSVIQQAVNYLFDSSLYDWFYRPEMQYSVFSFDPTKITPAAGRAGPPLPNGLVTIDLTKKLADVIYLDQATLLFGSNLDVLQRLGIQTRTFSINLTDANSNITTLTVDQNGKLTISDPTALAAIDFSMLSLFQTDDPANVLWETPSLILVGPDMELAENKITTGDSTYDANATSTSNPQMPDLLFEVKYPGNLSKRYATASYDWRIMVEYEADTPDVTARARHALLTSVAHGGPDGFVMPAGTSITDITSFFQHDNAFVSAGGLTGSGNSRLRFSASCAQGDAQCIPWDNNFGGGFIYAAVKVTSVDENGAQQIEWLDWGNETDRTKRKVLAAQQPTVNAIQAYIANYAAQLTYTPADYGGVTRAQLIEAIKSVAQRETATQPFVGSLYAPGTVGWEWMRGRRDIPTIETKGGFNLMQITQYGTRQNPQYPTYREIWDWKANLDTAVTSILINEKMQAAYNHLTGNAHTPTALEVLRGTFSRYNGGNYYTWVQRNGNGQQLPTLREFQLMDGQFLANGQVQWAVTFSTDDYYRDMSFCEHGTGPVYTHGATVTPARYLTGQRRAATNSGTYLAYQFDTVNNRISSTSQLFVLGNCYSDRRDIDPSGIPDDSVITAPTAVTVTPVP